VGYAATQITDPGDAQGVVSLEGDGGLTDEMGEMGPHPAGCSTTARRKRTTQ
jgi:hypothetical protein